MPEIVNKPESEGYYWANVTRVEGHPMLALINVRLDSHEGFCFYDTGGWRLTGYSRIEFLEKINPPI